MIILAKSLDKRNTLYVIALFANVIIVNLESLF